MIDHLLTKLTIVPKVLILLFLTFSLMLCLYGFVLGHFFYLQFYPRLVELWQHTAIATLISSIIFSRGITFVLARCVVIYTTVMSILGETVLLEMLGVSLEPWLVLTLSSFLLVCVVLYHKPFYDKIISL